MPYQTRSESRTSGCSIFCSSIVWWENRDPGTARHTVGGTPHADSEPRTTARRPTNDSFNSLKGGGETSRPVAPA